MSPLLCIKDLFSKNKDCACLNQLATRHKSNANFGNLVYD